LRIGNDSSGIPERDSRWVPAREHIYRHFSFDRFLDSYEELYLRAIEKHQPANAGAASSTAK